jgi:hypothetical protein
VGVAAAIVFALPSLWYPFAGDQGLHWYLGKGILLGEVPYTNAISTKPPGAFLVHAVSIALLGDRQSSIRVVDLAFILLAGGLIATFRRRSAVPTAAAPPTRDGEVGAACVLAAGIYYTFFDFNDTAHPTLWQGVALLGSAWLIARAPDGKLSRRAAFAAGALACLSVTLGHASAIAGVVLGAAAVSLGLARQQGREALWSGVMYTSGVACVLGLTLAPFILTGTLDAFWNVTVDFTLGYAERAPDYQWSVPPWLKPEHGGGALVAALTMLGVGLAITGAARNRRERRLGYFCALMTLTALGIVVAMKRAMLYAAFNYYFMLTVPFLALLIHWGLRQRFSRRPVHQLVTAIFLVGLAFALGPKWATHGDWSYRAEWGSWLDHVQGERTWAQLHAAHYRSPIDSYVRQHRAAAEVARTAREGDTMCADGFVPILYHLTGLRCPSRLVVGDVAGHSGPLREEHDRAQREHPPDFIVTFSDRPPRIRELERRGYVRHDVRDGRTPWYVVMRREDR